MNTVQSHSLRSWFQNSVFSFVLASFIATGALASGSGTKPQHGINPPVNNFHVVTDQIWRSARPSEAALKIMQQSGMTVDLDLENNPSVISAEQAMSSRDGFQFMLAQMSATQAVDEAQMDQVLAYLKAPPAHGVILVHCHYGEDRTGLVIGLYRVLVQGWPADKAYKEMLAIGFHPMFKDLDDYFRKRTHYTGN